MVPVGVIDTRLAVPACRNGFRVEVDVNQRSIIFVMVVVMAAACVILAVRRQVDVLVWRHKQRQQQGQTCRKHGKTAHVHPIMHSSCQ